jgi:amino acid transporter
MDGDKASVTRAAPRPLLSVFDGIVLICGMVIGVGIFKTPSIVAANTAGSGEFVLAWLFGGLISLCGALVYAELVARYPVTGGEYTFLSHAFGKGVSFVFAWSRITVIQTGAIAGVAYVFGDYASQLYSIGANGTAIYAALAVVGLTALNLVGTIESKSLQKVLQIALFAALIFIGVAGVIATGVPKPLPTGSASGSFGLAMILVLFTFGGWNEAAYLAGEVREPQRNMVRILVGGVVLLTALYLLVNVGYLLALGHGGMRESQAVGADLMRRVIGEKGAIALAIVVCTAALTTMNAAIFTGARTTWAMGRDFALFRRFGEWRESGSTPANALFLQGGIALMLVWAASSARDGFQAMVEYTAPVFWTFILLSALTLFVFRRRSKQKPTFAVPWYPVIPALFCLACAYMVYSSIDYALADYGPKVGSMVLVGLAVMFAGIPLYLLARRR